MLRAVKDTLVCGGCNAPIIALTLESQGEVYKIAALMEMMLNAVKQQTLVLCDPCIIRQQYGIVTGDHDVPA